MLAGAKYQAVTAADLRRVANTYFTKENRAVIVYTRKPGAAGAAEDPDLAGLSGEQKKAAEQMLKQLKGATDAAKLKERLERLNAQAGQAPAEMKPLLDLFKKKLTERIAELDKK